MSQRLNQPKGKVARNLVRLVGAYEAGGKEALAREMATLYPNAKAASSTATPSVNPK
jgi:hypothetical protein